MPPLEPLIGPAASSAPAQNAIEQVLAAATDGCEAEQSWLERARGGLERVVDLLAADPVLARAVTAEPAATGPAPRRPQWEAIEQLAACLEPRPGELNGSEDLPENVALMAVGGVAGLLDNELRAGRAAELPRRLPDLLFVMLVPYLGSQAAAREMEKIAAQRAT